MIKIKNISDKQVNVAGFACINAGDTVEVGEDKAKILLLNPFLEEDKASKNFVEKGVKSRKL